MECRDGCGACCIAPSIVEPFFGMPEGKAAGEPCVHLNIAMRCVLFGSERRPALCAEFDPEPAVCGEDREQALVLIGSWEVQSAPVAVSQGNDA